MNLTQVDELAKCYCSVPYFIDTFCKIKDDATGDWLDFKLWEKQKECAEKMQSKKYVIGLKARQVGFSWLAIGRILHKMIFTPGSVCLMFSVTDREGKKLMQRLKGMARRLPKWMVGNVPTDGKRGTTDHTLKLDNESECSALPPTAGDSYTAAIVLVDEADIIENLNALMRAAKPTVDAKDGQLFLISRSNKDEPESEFKRIYRAAIENKNSWSPVFASWRDRPDRNDVWYNDQKNDILTRTGSLDDLYEQYPATENEALSARVLNKRIPPEWLEQCLEVPFPSCEVYHDCKVSDLRVYIAPECGMRFVIGADPAEGLKSSDDSAIVVLRDDGKQSATLHGRIEIGVFSEYLIEIAKYFNKAKVMVERNNHGHAVIERVKNSECELLHGRDGRYGWLSDARGKTAMYADVADGFRDKQTTIADRITYNQLASIERSTLLAPTGLSDDVADAYTLAKLALNKIDVDIGEVCVV